MNQKPNLNQAARLLIRLAGPTVSGLTSWLNEKRNEHEQLDVHEWSNEFWYIVLEDKNIKDNPENALIGFTVNLETDTIFWSNSKEKPDFSNGGNCFCRSERWWRLASKFFGDQFKSDRKFGREGTVHDYRPKRSKP
jgi:hypothetical protein